MSERIEVSHEGTTTVGAARVFGAESIRRAVGFTDLIEPVAAVLAEYSRGHGAAPMVVFAPAGADGDGSVDLLQTRRDARSPPSVFAGVLAFVLT